MQHQVTCCTLIEDNPGLRLQGEDSVHCPLIWLVKCLGAAYNGVWIINGRWVQVHFVLWPESERLIEAADGATYTSSANFA
jgi:hypothetical protein